MHLRLGNFLDLTLTYNGDNVGTDPEPLSNDLHFSCLDDAPSRFLHDIITFAHRAHRDQRRNDGITPYIVHPARVAHIVASNGGSLNMIVAAWCHDIFEDCDPDAATIELSRLFLKHAVKSNDIAEIRDYIDRMTRKKFGANRMIMDITYIHDIIAENRPPNMIALKCADIIDNLIDSESDANTLRKTQGKAYDFVSYIYDNDIALSPMEHDAVEATKVVGQVYR